jgi:hypothetical protein
MQIKARTSPEYIRAARGVLIAALLVAAGAAAAPPAPQTGAPLKAATPRPTTSPFRQQRQSTKAQNYYVSRWGVDEMKVRSTNAGNLIRFTYRVVNPELASALNDKRNTPAMISERAQVVLQVPVMEKVGALRQSMPAEAGKDYWMVFSNKGNFVKPGDRVDVVIGTFHADGLMVE